MHQVACGFAFAEGPRWHDGAVIVTDIHDDAIKRVDAGGGVSTLVDLPSSPISTGFLSDGTMLVSGQTANCLWRAENGAVQTYADFDGLSTFDWGDIVVDSRDRVYIANQGICYPGNMPETIDSRIYLINGANSSRLMASGFLYANGLAITPDERQLIVAESFGHRLWRMPIDEDGGLGERRLVAQLSTQDRPDGICCDADGGIWSANATGRSVIRCTLDGLITDRISTGADLAIGCILGGPDGRDLFITTAPTADRSRSRELRRSALWRIRVDAPAGGRP